MLAAARGERRIRSERLSDALSDESFGTFSSREWSTDKLDESGVNPEPDWLRR